MERERERERERDRERERETEREKGAAIPVENNCNARAGVEGWIFTPWDYFLF
jgi:hypothetical protein